MARTINEIYKQIIDEKNTLAVIKDALAPTSAQVETLELLLAELNSRSRVALWRLLFFITAVCIWISEKFRDIFMADAEALVYKTGMGTPTWLRQKVLEFQFDEADPQNLYLDPLTLELAYPVIDPAKRVLTRCSVTSNNDGNTVVLVAKSEPPEAIDSTILGALEFYISKVNFCGRNVAVVSEDSDKLIIKGVVKVNPFFATVVEQRVMAAIDEYCKALSNETNFGGFIVVNEVIDVITNTEGVEDFKPEEISVRPASVIDINSRTRIYDLAAGTNNFKTATISGYLETETTAGYTPTDLLVFQ